ncbi:MAG: flagellar biosynthesis protein FlhF [Clostridiales bacterium]|jgi:flagellar biosynthesis protein FlhF|nr:flagellar biosynthesis protein FlhF [Clostridiales bacterium]
MVIKRYIGNTMQDVMTQVKADLGSDAIILNTKRIRKKGFFSWFSKPLIEVTAAIDNAIIGFSNHGTKEVGDTRDITRDDSYYKFERKVDAMEEMIRQLVTEFERDKDMEPQKTYGENRAYFDILISNEVNQKYALEIMEKAMAEYNGSERDFSKCFEQVILDYLGSDIQPIELIPGQRKVVLFVGPTGVGKTTTLAKLAAGFAIEDVKKVGLITADTYRIAAVDQLRVYAEILGIPMSVIYSPKDISSALDEHGDRDIVLIDTAGRSIKDENHEKEIKEIIEYGNIDDVYLVISANSTYQGCLDILKSYEFLGKYKLIFTKMDEITTYGTIINCKIISGKPLSYITTGQNVPVDIEIANIHKIKDLLMGNKDHEGSG